MTPWRGELEGEDKEERPDEYNLQPPATDVATSSLLMFNLRASSLTPTSQRATLCLSRARSNYFLLITTVEREDANVNCNFQLQLSTAIVNRDRTLPMTEILNFVGKECQSTVTSRQSQSTINSGKRVGNQKLHSHTIACL